MRARSLTSEEPAGMPALQRNVTARLLTNLGGLLCIAAVVAGCAIIEIKPSPATPEIGVRPKTDTVEHASPPALESEAHPQAPAPSPPTEPGKPFNLTVEGAIVLSLANNRSLIVEEVNPDIAHTLVSEQRAAFDPSLLADYTRTKDRLKRDLRLRTQFTVPNAGPNGQPVSSTVWRDVETTSKTRVDAGTAGIAQHLPTGADVSVSAGPTETRVRNSSSNPNLIPRSGTDSNGSTVQLTVTQSLLRGGGLGVNLASLRQARIDALSSQYELRGVAESLVAQVEQAYWDCLLAERQIGIYEESLALAQRIADEVEERIRIGKVAETERAAAGAQVAQGRSSLINARSSLSKARVALLRLVNPSDDALGITDVKLMTEPVMPEIDLSHVEDSIELAQRMRPDLNQARLQYKRDELEVVKTKNGLLPQLDVFLTLAKDLTRTEYQYAFQVANQDLRDRDTSTQVGAQFSYPIGNRAARARDERAMRTRQRDWEAVANMAQLVEQDVRTAYFEAARSREQIPATAATRRLQEETLEAETEKFRIGRSTTLLVAQAQRDLLTAQIDEVQAVAAYLKAIVDLYRLEGTLLERRGVTCPGREPVEAEKWPRVGSGGGYEAQKAAS